MYVTKSYSEGKVRPKQKRNVGKLSCPYIFFLPDSHWDDTGPHRRRTPDLKE